MKKTILKKDRRGFTLAELLAVFLILVILIGLGVPGFIALRKNIKIAEYDDIAREIYLAAQNQLTRLTANGMDKETTEKLSDDNEGRMVPYTEAPKDYDAVSGGEWKRDDYRRMSQGTDCVTLLLPLGAVSEDVRTNGFYTIEYNVSTYTVYGVFYSEKAFAYYDDVKDPGFRTSRDVRKVPMVGYYGGSAVRQNPQNYCETPRLEIINNNELRLIIKKGVETIDRNWIAVTVSDGEHTVPVPTERIDQIVSDQSHTVLLDSMIDGKRFKDLFGTPTPDFEALTPGKNLTITVTYSKPNYLPSSASIETNSLFATRELGTGVNGGDVVTIAWARHLQNLEHSVSNLDDQAIDIARQTDHIQWENGFGNFPSIKNQEGNTEYNKNLLRYEGSNLEIRDLTGENGLFAQTKANMELTAIRLVNPDIQAPAGNAEPVGALVGTAKEGTAVSSCGVYYNRIQETGDSAGNPVDYKAYKNLGVNGGQAITGGLVGVAQQKVKITNSFAALPSLKGGSGASLIGSATGCEITNSYANCDDLPTASFLYFIGGTGNTVDNCYAVGNVENDKPGSFADDDNTVTNSYYAVSHREFAADPKNNMNLAVTEFRYKVSEGAEWETTDYNGMASATQAEGWANHEEDWKPLIAPLTHPYREYLDGRAYPYPAIAHPSLGALDHYGSWPDGDGTVTLTVDMRLLGKTDYAFYAGRVVVKNLDETDATKQVLFDSRDHVKNNVFDGKNTVQIIPGTRIRIEITEETGYTYVSTGITETPENYEETIEHTVIKDTTVTVKYQQSAFRLTCAWPETEGGSTFTNQRTYAADCDNMTLVPNNTGNVEVGSEVVVRITGAPDNYPSGNVVVWYTLDNDATHTKHHVQKIGDSFPFDMPSGDATIHVQHTKKTMNLHVRFFLREPVDNGQFVEQEDRAVKTQYSAGTVIDQSLVEILADSSNLPLTLEDQNVLYLAKAILLGPSGTVDDESDYLFYSSSDDLGTVSYPNNKHKYISNENDNLFLNIYIDRKQYDITLAKGGNIDKVEFAPNGPATDGAATSVQKEKVYYGQRIEAVAEVIPGQVFTVWESSDHRFRMSSAPRYTFSMPHYDLTLTASATVGEYLVTLDLLENGESWLASSASRMADPITITLVSTKNPNKQYVMDCLTDENNSFIAQKIVPSIPDLGKGYLIRVNYRSGLETYITSGGDFYNPEGRTGDDRVLLTVRDRAVERELIFYSATYHANCKKYVGTVPTGGTYPEYFYLKVSGNPGLLRNTEEDPSLYLSGWKDVYAGMNDSDKALASGDRLMLTRRTDLFAQWGGEIRVIYQADGATGGIIPVDAAWYETSETPAVKMGEPERAGYTFEGWIKDGDETTLYRADGENSHISFTGNTDVVIMTAKWKQNEYTLSYYTLADGEWVPYGEPITGLHYDEKQSAIGMTDTPTFLGWSETKNGDVRYREGEPITVTGNMNLYARTAAQTVNVTYRSTDGNIAYETQVFGKGIGAYLKAEDQSGKPLQATAWSTEPYGKGTLYLCQETEPYRSLEPAAFSADINLYLVTGNIYNFTQQTWHNTLYDAKNRAGSGDTLIVYRDTWEDYSVWINKNLSIIASGNRTITWKEGAKPGVNSNTTLKKEIGGEFAGCMGVAPGKTVTFGKTDIATLSMNGSTLTFDANEQSRVIALQSGTLNMYDGVTLTNGWRPESDSQWANDGWGYHKANVRSYMGGGVYAGDGSLFNMYGGTISRCSAYCGGGVYLYKGSKMQMGNMETPTHYSSTAIYYTKDENTGEYINVPTTPGPEEYKEYFVTTGNPQICYNTSTRTDGGSFNKADGGGGLLMLDLKDGDLILYRGGIRNNHANANGGGIVTDGGASATVPANDAKLRIYEVDISHNSAYGDGGGIFQWQGVVFVYNSTIRQNHSGRNGGGVYLHHWQSENSDVDFYYGDISGNRAEGNGGGVYVEKLSDMWIRYGNLYGNRAGNKGGGVYLQTDSADLPHLYLHKGSIRDNQQSGGSAPNDVYLDGGNTYMTVLETTATEQGGLFLEQDEDTKIHVDCGDKGDGTKENGRNVVYYPNADDFKEQDTDFFVYDPGTVTDFLITPVEPDHLKLVNKQNILRDVFFYPNYTNADGSEPEAEKKEMNLGATVNYPTFTRVGYDLIGWAASPDADIEQYLVYRKGGIWYTEYDRANGQWRNPLADADGNPDPAGVPTYSVTRDYDQKLYAMWKPYTVTYHLRTTNAAVEIAQEESIGPKVRILFPTKQYTEEGITYTFIGWTTVENGNTPAYTEDQQEITLTESIDLYAVWQPDKVSITFDFTGGTLVGNQPSYTQLIPWNQNLTIPKLEITRAGHIHKGWSKAKDSSTADYGIEGIVPAEDLKEDRTLYAVWAEAVTVTFDCNGGESEGSKKLDQSIEKGTKITLNVIPTRLNYDFLGWADTKESTVPTHKTDGEFGPVNENATLYAVWRAKVPAKLMMNDGTNNAAFDTMESVDTEYSLGTPMRTGYNFLGWAASADDDTPKYQANQTITIPAEGITLYAVWEKDPCYTVTLDPNGGAWEDGKIEAIEVAENKKGVLIIPDKMPQRDGYVFLGWSTDVSATVAQQLPGEIIHDLTGNRAFYAVWQEVTSEVNAAENGAEDAASATESGTGTTAAATEPVTVQPETEAATEPQTEAAALPPEGEATTSAPKRGTLKPQTWEVTIFPDGGAWMENAMLDDEPLEDPLWDEEEEFFTFTVPVGEDMTILPPVLEREGYVLYGWMWMDEEEPDPDKWEIYPADEEIPVIGDMKWIPVWIEEEQPTAQMEEDPFPIEAPPPPETEPPTEQATEPPKSQEPESPAEPETEPPTQLPTEPPTTP